MGPDTRIPVWLDGVVMKHHWSALRPDLRMRFSRQVLIHNVDRHLHHRSYNGSKDMDRLLQRHLQLSLFSHFLFCCIYSQFFPLISISFLIWSIHLVWDLPLGSIPSIFVRSIFLGILSSPICITYPYHLNLLFWLPFLISSTASSNAMLVFLILCFVLFKITLNIFISMAWIGSSLFFCCWLGSCSIWYYSLELWNMLARWKVLGLAFNRREIRDKRHGSVLPPMSMELWAATKKALL